MESRLYKHSFKLVERPLTSLSVYNTGLQRCEGGYTWGPGVRDHYLVHYVTAGRGTYTVQGKTYTVNMGELFLAKPGEMITYRADAQEPWSYCWVGFGGMEAKAVVGMTDFAHGDPVLRVEQGEKARQLILDIYEARGARPFEVTRMTGRLYAFLAWLMEIARFETKRKRQAGLEHVQRACDFIATNYANPISITDIAARVGVCRSLLNRAFQQHMEISPIQYLTRYRITQACQMLEQTDMAVKAIAFSVGYEDPLYFSRRFREVTGCSPRDYAQRHVEAAGNEA